MSAPDKRPTVWIVLCCVLAVGLVGVGIWAFSEQSDADDAQARLATAQQQAAKAATPAPTAASGATTIDPAIRQQFEQLAGALGLSGANVDQIQQALESAAAKVKSAQQDRDAAKGALDTAKAQAAAVGARVELTRSCLNGTLSAISTAFGSGGVDAARQQLETIVENCKSVASP